jgi:hypothetical protein
MKLLEKIKAFFGLDFMDQACRQVKADEDLIARSIAQQFTRGSIGIQKGAFQTRGDLDEALKRAGLPPTLPREE